MGKHRSHIIDDLSRDVPTGEVNNATYATHELERNAHLRRAKSQKFG